MSDRVNAILTAFDGLDTGERKAVEREIRAKQLEVEWEEAFGDIRREVEARGLTHDDLINMCMQVRYGENWKPS